MSSLRRHPESHLAGRISWLRAAVLGANNGIVSTAITAEVGRLGPCVDGSGLARACFTRAAVVGAAMCSACYAVHVTAGHNALRGSGPGQLHAFEDAVARVVVLIAGSTGSALRAVRLPNRSHHAECCDAISSMPLLSGR
jgi:hypothetical protein